MSIGQFRSVLTAIGLDPMPQEVAEILWLAAQLPPGTVSVDPPEGAAQPGPRASGPRPDEGGDEAASQDPARVPVYTRAHVGADGTSDRLPARVVRLPAGSPLPQRLHLLRALRPLKRRVPSRHLSEVDEEQTAERSAERFLTHGRRALMPVVRPSRERWLDAVLVVDSHPTSRMLWTSLTDDVHRLLIQLGAFRDVRVRFLHLTADGPLGVSAESGSRTGRLRSTSELCDPSGRRLLLILTDGVAPGWNRPQVHDAVRQWAETGPVAFVQALPERLWSHTALPVVPARLRRPARSMANTDLAYTGYRRRTRTLPVGSVPVPVLELAPRWLGPWARLVAGQGDGGVDTAVMLVGVGSRAAAAPDTRTPGERLQDFHATATPDAFRLLSCLSAVPLNVSVMRLVQAAILPESSPSVLAEVAFSGLLEAGEAAENTPAEDVPYDFLPGVRAELLAGLRSHEVDTIHREVSRFLERSAAGASGRVTGLIPDVRGTAALSADTIPWARLGASVLASVGLSGASAPPESERSRRPAPVTAAPDPLAGPYRLTNYLTRAHFSDVFIAIDDHGNEALVKVEPEERFHSAPDLFRALLKTEAESLRRMDGRYAPRLLGVDTEAAASWLAMEVVQPVSRGPALDLSNPAWAQNSTPGDPLPLLHLLRGLAEMLVRAHSRGIVHGNLSPHAVLPVADSVVVISWMYAQHDGQLHRYARYRPTRAKFLPPEGYSTTEPLDPSFDVYGVGAILAHEMNRLGTVPHDQYAAEPTDVLPYLYQLVERCTASNPGERPTADELLRQTRLLGETPPSPRHPARQPADTGGTRQESAAAPEARTEQGDEAIALLEQVVADREWLLGGDHLDTLTARTNLVASYGQAGRTGEAVALLEQVVADRERLLGGDHPDTLTTRANLAAFYGQAGRVEEAIALLEQVVADSERLLGGDHPSTLTARANFAASYRQAGRVEEAIALLEQVVADSGRLLGGDHPSTLTAQSNLAASYRQAGRRGEAIALSELVAADRERLLGGDHPDTLTARANLATSYGQAGRAEEAAALLEQVVADRERLLAGDHPSILTARANLAASYGQAGRTGEAVALLEQVVADRERLLGGDHPDILTARANLATSYGQAGRAEEAVALLEQVVADRERLLGGDHPSTLTARSNLATFYRQTGRTGEAVALLEQVVADRERLLGGDHPDILTARANLAASYRQAGRVEEAIALLEEVVPDSERLLGGDHPDTLTARSDLAASYRRAGRVEEAVALLEQVVADRERLLGGDHPSTLTARSNLATFYRQTGRTGEAVALLEQVVADRERLLGGDHPDILTARANLAASYRQAGRVEEAVALLEQVVADRERLLGGDHPDTLTARSDLATSYRRAGRVEEAIALLEQVVADSKQLLGDNHPSSRAAKVRLESWN